MTCSTLDLLSGKMSTEIAKDEGFSSPPASPVRSPPTSQFQVQPQEPPPAVSMASMASMASLASLAVAGLSQAPGSYPHVASGPGQPQTNGGFDSRPLQQEHRQPQVRRVL